MNLKKILKSVKRFVRRGALLLIFGTKYISLEDLLDIKPINPSGKSENKTIYWLGSFPPWQRNIGDHAQTYAINLFLRKHFPDFNIVRYDRHKITKQALEKVRANAQETDFVLVSSNGDFGDLYAGDPSAMSHVRREIAETITGLKKIYLASTVYYKDVSPQNNWVQKDSSLFSDPSNTILCREKKSLDMLRMIGLEGSVFPDIVFYLKPTRIARKIRNNNRALVVLRDIKRESSLSMTDHETILRLTRESGFQTHYQDVHYARSPLYDFMYKKYFSRLNEMYQGFDLVITDRMHSMIFAALNGVPCVAINNEIPHKISAYQDWLWQNTVFIDAVQELPQAIRKTCDINPEPIDLSREFVDFRERYVA